MSAHQCLLICGRLLPSSSRNIAIDCSGCGQCLLKNCVASHCSGQGWKRVKVVNGGGREPQFLLGKVISAKPIGENTNLCRFWKLACLETAPQI